MKNKRTRLAVICLALACLVFAAVYLRLDYWAGGVADRLTATPVSAPASRPTTWAEPIASGHLKNFYRVAPGLYRGAQPDAEGFQELQTMGVRSVVNLRWMHSDLEMLRDTDLNYTHISFNPLRVEDEDVVEFLKHVTNGDNQPVFVHCQFGADRTGTMCAMYRICVQGWSKEDAIGEMTQGDMGFHGQWVNLAQYIRSADVEKIKKDAGLQ